VPPVVVFTTASDIEASVVMALLDSHGIHSIRVSGSAHALWPMTVSALGPIRIAVPHSAAEDARRIIDSHREEVGARVVPLRREFEALEDRIGYRFRDRGLLEHALTHKSRAAEDASGGVIDNESLEFLGDAVLGLVVADALFHQYPTSTEGDKSKMKAAVVSTQSLARHAEGMGLGVHLILGRGEEKTGGRRKQALLADAYEALIAAIFLDGGLEAAGAFLRRELKDALDAGSTPLFARDYKSALQERLQALGQPLPEYRVSGEAGPDHRKLFSIDVVVAGQVLGGAVGRAKKEAEQEAARLALERLDRLGDEALGPHDDGPRPPGDQGSPGPGDEGTREREES
jgi:ribonuclease-3